MVCLVFLTTAQLPASPTLTAFNSSLIAVARKATTTPPNYRLQTVVIDAGHGGKDPGGMGSNSMEKHIALSIATMLADRIRNDFPDITVIMTRSDDTFIPLFERAAMANRNRADLFISIHANIMPGSKATYGTETFVMGQHVADYNLNVAKRENASILMETDYETNYDYDPTSDEGHILMSMYQNAFLEQSILFAELVEQQFANRAQRKSRGVKQAGFVVLKATAMPSVLVETGFMSNPGEEKYLLSEVGQQQLADAIFEAFRAYRQLTDAGGTPSISRATTKGIDQVSSMASLPPFEKPLSSQPEMRVNRNATPPMLSPRVREVTTNQRPPFVAVSEPVNVRMVSATPGPANPSVLKKEVSLYAQAPAIDPGLIPATYASPATRIESPVQREKQPAEVPTFEPVIFAVQLAATQRELAMTEDRWAKMTKPLVILKEGDLFKYQVRGINTSADALITRRELVTAGFEGAFIVAYKNGEKLSGAETRALLNN